MVTEIHAEAVGTREPDLGEALAVVAGEYLGHAVIASGTESIGSSQSLEQLMNPHVSRNRDESMKMFSVREQFKFGDGQVQEAEPFVEIPQQIYSWKSYKLGARAIDAPGVPVLLSSHGPCAAKF